jgi:very-short-patch-repair endonuclease
VPRPDSRGWCRFAGADALARADVEWWREAVRQNRLRLLGWAIPRFAADDVLRKPARVLAQVCTAISTIIN